MFNIRNSTRIDISHKKNYNNNLSRNIGLASQSMYSDATSENGRDKIFSSQERIIIKRKPYNNLSDEILTSTTKTQEFNYSEKKLFLNDIRSRKDVNSPKPAKIFYDQLVYSRKAKAYLSGRSYARPDPKDVPDIETQNSAFRTNQYYNKYYLGSVNFHQSMPVNGRNKIHQNIEKKDLKQEAKRSSLEGMATKRILIVNDSLLENRTHLQLTHTSLHEIEKMRNTSNSGKYASWQSHNKTSSSSLFHNDRNMNLFTPEERTSMWKKYVKLPKKTRSLNTDGSPAEPLESQKRISQEILLHSLAIASLRRQLEYEQFDNTVDDVETFDVTEDNTPLKVYEADRSKLLLAAYSTLSSDNCCEDNPHQLPRSQRDLDYPSEQSIGDDKNDDVTRLAGKPLPTKAATSLDLRNLSSIASTTTIQPSGYNLKQIIKKHQEKTFDFREVGGGRWVNEVWEANTVLPATLPFYFTTPPR